MPFKICLLSLIVPCLVCVAAESSEKTVAENNRLLMQQLRPFTKLHQDKEAHVQTILHKRRAPISKTDTYLWQIADFKKLPDAFPEAVESNKSKKLSPKEGDNLYHWQRRPFKRLNEEFSPTDSK